MTVLHALAPRRRPPIIVAITNLRIMVFTFRKNVMRNLAHPELYESKNAEGRWKFLQELMSAARALPRTRSRQMISKLAPMMIGAPNHVVAGGNWLKISQPQAVAQASWI